MNSAGRGRLRRVVLRALVAAIALVAIGAAWCFPRAGQYLIVEAPLERADAIVVLAGSRVERWREAVDLYRDGWAPAIVLSPGRLEAAERQLRASGIRFPSDAELARDALIQFHIPATVVSILPNEVDNTAQEAEEIRGAAAALHWRRIIVVTSKYHTRRVAFAFSRALRGTGVQPIVRATRYDTARPDEWWRHRGDFRFVTSEWQKLLAYRLGLGGGDAF